MVVLVIDGFVLMSWINEGEDEQRDRLGVGVERRCRGAVVVADWLWSRGIDKNDRFVIMGDCYDCCFG
jgi:hypothetical protein